MVWYSDGNSFRFEYANRFNDNDTLILLVTKCDLEGNDPNDNSEYPKDLEKESDFMPVHCTKSILIYHNNKVTGCIVDVSNDTTIAYSDFFNVLNLSSWTTSSFKYDKDIVIYPNPSKGLLNISFEQNYCDYQLEIISLLGHIEITKKITCNHEKCSINTQNLNSGIYIVRLTFVNNNVINRKFAIY